MTACIVGWNHSRFGKLDGQDIEELMTTVARGAMEDAGVSPEDIDAVYVSHFNGGLVEQEFTGPLVLQADDRLRFKPVTRVENACASGSAAVYQGLRSIAAKEARYVLVVGAEKMTAASGADVGKALLRASYRREENFTEGGFAAVFESIQSRYFQAHGDQRAALARIAAKNHTNGADNPLAHIQKPLDFEFCNTVSEKNPLVVGTMRRTDCSLVSDGAAALVLADVETALRHPKAIVFRGRAQVNDFLPISKRDPIGFDGPHRAWAQAYEDAGVGVKDLDFAEVHDCFTIAELLAYEAMGLAPKGQGARAIEEGWVARDGKLPVNLSGGLKAKGHPIGATGVSMHVMAAMQLMGQADKIQAKDAELGAIFNMGGMAVANYVSILERLR